jgi:hypothetical protein
VAAAVAAWIAVSSEAHDDAVAGLVTTARQMTAAAVAAIPAGPTAG